MADTMAGKPAEGINRGSRLPPAMRVPAVPLHRRFYLTESVPNMAADPVARNSLLEQPFAQ